MGDHQTRKVSSTADLLAASADETVREIRVTGPLASVPTLRLAPGQSLVCLLLVTPTISLPVGCAFSQPAPECSAWYKKEKTLKKQGVAKSQRPPKPPANPAYPTKQQLALRLLERFHAHHPTVRIHCIMADALYGTAPFVDGASVTFGGVQVISQIRSNQNVRVHKRDQHVAAYFATHPGTPHTIRIRGGEEVIAIVGSARL